MSTGKSTQDNSPRGIMKSTFIISLGTLSSRVLGFVRDIVIAKLLGTGASADAFFVAFRIPNLFRDVIGEGAANSTVVPVFSEYAGKKEKHEVWNFFSVLFIWSLITLSTLTILGIILAPFVVSLIAPGFHADASKLFLTINLTKMMFPYLIFIGLTAYCMAILYTFRSFASSAFGPCLLNIAMIAGIFVASKTRVEPVLGLAIGVLVGGVLQLLVQVGPLAKSGIRFVRPTSLVHPGAKKIRKLLFPRLLGTGVYQLNIFVDTLCASLVSIVGAGGVSALYYANRIIQFPLGVGSIALALAVLPVMSGFASEQKTDELRTTLIFSVKNILFIMLPISFFALVFAQPIIQILFQRGEFDGYSTAITSAALAFYSLGLVSYAGARMMVTAFHSLQDTKTPVRVAALCLAVNLLFNFILMYPFKVGGIALASAIAGTVNFFLLLHLMEKRLGGICVPIKNYFWRIILPSAFLTLTAWVIWKNTLVSSDAVRLMLAAFVGAVVFVVSCFFLKVEQMSRLAQWICVKK